GALGDGKGSGPTDPAGKDEEVGGRELALDRPAPWPVGKPTRDVSVYGIHQLVSNGLEWTGVDGRGQRVTLFQPPAPKNYAKAVGHTWETQGVLTYTDILQTNKISEWIDTKDDMGFRLVLEPR